MSTSPDSKSSRRRIGPFTIEGRLGVGGMGVVYKGLYDKDGKYYAVKVLAPGVCQNPQVIARFEREMNILKRMNHPHIVRYFGGGKSGGQRFFAMEFMPGGSVEGLLKKKKVLPWEEAIELLIDTAKALEFAHTQGVIHRDLKPANLFMCQDGHVKLGDFGIARDTDATALTAAGKTVGTYAYMAPEQINGHPPLSRQTDLYALGCVAFEMLAGRPPFVAESPAQMLFGHLNEQPPHVREFSIECPLWLDNVVDRLITKDPEGRYFDALAVQVALEEVKQKVAEQESYVRQTVQGGVTAPAITRDQKQLRNLVSGKKKKKRKKKNAPPFYEQGWFLVIALVLVVGGATWAAWPASEAELYADAAELMDSPNPTDWQTAHEEYLKPFLARFPESAHIPQVKAWVQQAEVSLLERQVENLVDSDREPRNETERLLVGAWHLEEEEPLLAAAKYKALIKLKEGEQQSRLYVVLAEKRLRPIELGIGSKDEAKVATIEKALEEANMLFNNGQIAAAQERWNSIIILYADNPTLTPYVRRAQELLQGKRPEAPVDLEDPAPDSRSQAEAASGDQTE